MMGLIQKRKNESNDAENSSMKKASLFQQTVAIKERYNLRLKVEKYPSIPLKNHLNLHDDKDDCG